MKTWSPLNQAFLYALGTAGVAVLAFAALSLSSVISSNAVLGLLIVITAGASWSINRNSRRQRLVEERFRGREEQYQMLLNEIQDYAVVMLDAQGRIVAWNSGAERIKGYNAEQIVGQSFSCFFPAEDIKRGRPERVLQLAAANGRFDEEGICVRKDGSQFMASVTFTALRDAHGLLLGFSEISRDLSESRDSEAKYRGLLEAAPDAMVVVNREGEIVLLNLQAEKQFGYYRDELIGQKVVNIIPEGFAERLIADGTRTAADALAQQIGTGIELTGRRKNGGQFPIEIMLSPLESADGILVTAAIRDISVRKEAEKHLAQIEGQYRGLLEAAPDAMVVVNQNGRIVLLNLQAEKQFGYRRDELVGQMVKNIIPKGFAERLIADGLRSAEDAREQQIGTGIELIAKRKNGSEFPIEIMLSPLEGADGVLVTAAIRDISVRKHMERLKDEFVSTVSHELRTPLTSISGSLGLLMGQWAGKLPDSAARLLAIAHKNSQRLVRLTNDILDIEKIESGHVSFNLSRVDVRQLVEQSIESNRGFSESYGVSVRSDFASMTGEVNADPDRLAQVVTNLLSNAIKFSPSDGEVVVAVETIDNIVRISVRDHGSGIPADFRPHVFEKFAQADATNSRQKGGTGLGLSIVKQIVERLGGNVGFDDAPNRGTIFYIELPGYVEAVNTQRDSQASVSIPRIATAAVVLQHIRRPRVLHVDDDSEVLTAVSHALTAVAEVVSASSIADARHAIEADQIDLAVLDIFLGPESGLDLLPDLQVADGVMIPVIVFSADVTGVACDEQVQVTLSKLGSSLERLVVAVRDRLALSAGQLVEETVL